MNALRAVLRGVRLLLAVAAACFVVAFLPSTAWSTTTTPEPSPSSSPPADPTPTTTPAEPVTVTAEPSPGPAAPGVDSGVYVDPASGSVRVDENTGVAIGVAGWLLALTAGALTAWLVLP